MGVAIHKTGHDELAATVDALGGLEGGVRRAQQGDAALGHAHGLVAGHACGVGEQDGRVRNENVKHGCLLIQKGTDVTKGLSLRNIRWRR